MYLKRHLFKKAGLCVVFAPGQLIRVAKTQLLTEGV